MHQDALEEDDDCNDDDEASNAGRRSTKKQGHKKNKLDTTTKNIKTSLQLRKELIDLEKQRHLTRRLVCLNDGYWKGSHMWLPVDMLPEMNGAIPKNKIPALMKVNRINPQVVNSVDYSYEVIYINKE